MCGKAASHLWLATAAKHSTCLTSVVVHSSVYSLTWFAVALCTLCSTLPETVPLAELEAYNNEGKLKHIAKFRPQES